MQIYQKEFYEMTPQLFITLKTLRKERGFEVESYIQNKTQILNQYMSDCGLDTCVIALSGGLDSSVVFALAVQASKQPNSPIKKIVPVSIPANNEGATNQNQAFDKAAIVANHFGYDLEKVEIGGNVNDIVQNINTSFGMSSDNWAKGQAVSYTRTATIYSITSLCTANGYRPIVVGTTNRDEGAYIGYFGKASDGMVDIQLISDAHKTDLKMISEYFKIPSQIATDSPTGDMYDGRLDEEVFGVPYAFIELYTYYLQDPEHARSIMSESALTRFEQMAVNVENMHKYNGHKYMGASPAVHLDIFESRVKGGWQYNTYLGKVKECENPTVGDHKEW